MQSRILSLRRAQRGSNLNVVSGTFYLSASSWAGSTRTSEVPSARRRWLSFQLSP
ncbi:MAG: hypothetical protein K0B14_18420 [Anaerolineaceae bacterium]|nr:hypothetical protein [Anaerolineaceae bacterium]